MAEKFAHERGLLKDPSVLNILNNSLEKVPEYFYQIPASSSGKYHPEFALGFGGLYRHTRATVVVATELFKLDDYKFSDLDKEIIIASLILHDTFKLGYKPETGTLFEHPDISAKNVLDSTRIKTLRELYCMCNITLNIKSHMGQWNTSKYSRVVLMRPVTKMQKFVHLCDYLASRKSLEVFLENENV